MPQLLALALVGAGLYAGYRWVARSAREVLAESERRTAAARQRHRQGEPIDRGALVWDESAQVYRPNSRRD